MGSKKGISLPLNAIILIIIGVTVLIAVLIAFTTNIFGGTETAAMESALTRGCMAFKYQYGCDPDKIGEETGKIKLEYKIGNKRMTLGQICQESKGVDDLPACCGCTPPTTSP